jgi:hypothetical protein
MKVAHYLKLLLASITVASLAAPIYANAAETVRVSCSVAVDYQVNGVSSESYRKDFVVQPGVGFADDFSTNLQQKFFNASVAREAGNLAVAIDYFSDVNTFDSVNFNTRLTLHGRGIESTSGSSTFSSSQGAQPGNHTTNYALTCHRL